MCNDDEITRIRGELMLQLAFTDVPDWVVWISVDKDGETWGWNIPPVTETGFVEWIDQNTNGVDCVLICVNTQSLNGDLWKECLFNYKELMHG